MTLEMSTLMGPGVEEEDVLALSGDAALRASLDSCVKCTICETQCPVMRVTDLFAGPKYSGPQAERFRKAGQMVDKSIDYCSSCGTCSLVCPQGVKVTEIIHHRRTAMKEAHGIPLRDRLIGRTSLIGTMMTPVLVPKHGCCGLALQSNGLYDDARKYVSKLTNDLRSVNRDAPIISASGSCGGMLRHEAHEILEMDTPELRDVGSRTWDISEFLLHLYDKGELDTNFQRIDVTIPYHAPCQVKSQGLGKPAIELMSLIPGVTVKDSEQPCCGIAGTYGMKKEKYAIAQAVGAPVFDFIKQVNAELAACDTETCRWQLRTATGANVVHPIWLIHKAYGLPNG